MSRSRIINREERRAQREKNKEELDGVLKKTDEIAARVLDPIQKRHEDIKSQIVELHEKRQTLLEKPLSKEEFIKIAKENLASERKRCMERMLNEHLEKCLCNNLEPFTPKAIASFAFHQFNMSALFAVAITDEYVENVVNQLPDVGLSQKERDAQIKNIDNEVKQLNQLLDDELSELKK